MDPVNDKLLILRVVELSGVLRLNVAKEVYGDVLQLEVMEPQPPTFSAAVLPQGATIPTE